jgi:hypothetical protein
VTNAISRRPKSQHVADEADQNLIGYIFPAGHDMQGYINPQAYGEFDNTNLPDGWSVWPTFGLAFAERPKSRALREYPPPSLHVFAARRSTFRRTDGDDAAMRWLSFIRL